MTLTGKRALVTGASSGIGAAIAKALAAEGADAVPTGMALTRLDPVFRERPDEYLDMLRSREPVHQDRVYDRVVLTRAADVEAVMNNRKLASDPRKSRPGSFSRVRLRVDEAFRPLILHMDDPDHQRLRSLVLKAFNQVAVDAMRPRITEVACGLLKDIDDPSCFDIMDAYARPLPTIAIALMLGVDTARRHDFKQWSEGKMQMFNPQRTPEQETILASCDAALAGYFTEVIQKRRKERRADLISGLIDAEENGRQLDEAEIVGVCIALLIAGNVTTTDLIGNAVLALLQHPGELSKLLAEPNLVRSTVEEVLRYDSPVMQGSRIATEAMQIGGCPVAAGQPITAMLYAANHDPEAHPDPKRFDIERPDKRHNSFGGGAHFCLGAPLARAEAQIALSMLFEQFPKLRLRTDRPVERRTMLNFNGLEALWVRAD